MRKEDKDVNIVTWFHTLVELEGITAHTPLFSDFGKTRQVIRKAVKAHVKRLSIHKIDNIISFFDSSIRLLMFVREALGAERAERQGKLHK